MVTKQTNLEGKAMDEAKPGDLHYVSGGKVFRNFRDARGKSIGLVIELHGDRIFWKPVKKAKHFHRNHRAWAIAVSVCEELKRDGVKMIMLDTDDQGTIYATLEDFIEHSCIDRFPPYEEQRFLHQSYWKPGYWRKEL